MRWVDVERDGWESALAAVQREGVDIDPAIEDAVLAIISDVRARGDAALLELGREFDSEGLCSLAVDPAELDAAGDRLDHAVREALEHAAASIRAFHEAQLRTSWFQHADGKIVGQLIRPLERVGVYVPGGRAAYPSSVLMCAIPARVAGVREVVVCSPVAKDGSVSPAVLYAARLAGVQAVYKVGGAQAVAALAYGTATIPRVDKIVGPGNTYVCAAKRALWGVTDMDMLAGPSEVCVVADETADPRFVAADLITQAEHDPDCAAFLLTPSRSIAEQTQQEILRQLDVLPRRAIAEKSLMERGACVVTRTLDEALELANACAPEHLALLVENPFGVLDKVRNAGAVMLGHWTPQTAGDYMAGPSHTLPTGGTARFWSPLNVDTFLKKTSIIALAEGALLSAADDLIALASAEGFEGHAAAVRTRLQHDRRSDTVVDEEVCDDAD